jgi:hypothetical protein
VKTVALTLSLVAAYLVLTPQAGQAAMLCWMNGCTGLNPETTGCSANAVTQRSKYWAWNGSGPGYYGLELKYSSSCFAYWGRFVRDDCDVLPQHGYWLKIRAEVRTPDDPYNWYLHREYFKDVPASSCDSMKYTLMVGDGEPYRFTACYFRYDHANRPANPAGISHSQWDCLPWKYWV